MADQDSDFRTHEELRDLLERIGLKLHAKNRIAGGEDTLVWHIAETIRAAGRLALRSKNDPQFEPAFDLPAERDKTSECDELDQFMQLLMTEIKVVQ